MTLTIVTTKKKLARLSLCPRCSFPVLDEEIRLGQEYVVLVGAESPRYKMGCGGCGAVFDPGPTVLAFGILNPSDPPLPLPLALFQDISSSVEPTPVP